MTMLPFADWKPDLSPYKAASSQLIQNVFPRHDGYGPVASVSPYSQALPGACRGYFYARNADQSVTVFAATASKLYKLNNTDFSWTDAARPAAAIPPRATASSGSSRSSTISSSRRRSTPCRRYST